LYARRSIARSATATDEEKASIEGRRTLRFPDLGRDGLNRAFLDFRTIASSTWVRRREASDSAWYHRPTTRLLVHPLRRHDFVPTARRVATSGGNSSHGRCRDSAFEVNGDAATLRAARATRNELAKLRKGIKGPHRLELTNVLAARAAAGRAADNLDASTGEHAQTGLSWIAGKQVG